MTRTSTTARRRSRAKTTSISESPELAGPVAPFAAITAVAEPAPTQSAAKNAPREATKLALIIAALRSDEGASVASLAELTGWKMNSVRGVLAGTLKTRHGLAITSVKTEGVRVYRAAKVAAC